jgi:hypothetical protein
MRWSADIRDFGAVPGDGNDHTVAWQAAFSELGPLGGEIDWQGGQCNLSATVVSPTGFSCPSINAIGPHACVLNHPNGTAFRFVGGSGGHADAVVEGIDFEGNAAFPAVEVQGQNGLTFLRCTSNKASTLLYLNNLAAGSFTEWVVAEKCFIDSGCAQAIVMAVNGGKNSFNGSGLSRCRARSYGVKPLVQVKAGANAYLGPLDVMVWSLGPMTVVQNDSAIPALFETTIRGECTAANPITLGAGAGPIGLANLRITGAGEFIRLGTAQPFDWAVQTAIGGLAWATPQARSITMLPGANVLCRMANPSRLLVTIEGANYDYRYIVEGSHQGFGGAGLLGGQPINVVANNQAGYGAPVFSVDSSGNLIVTNPNWPTTGTLVKALIDGHNEGQIFQSPRWNLN